MADEPQIDESYRMTPEFRQFLGIIGNVPQAMVAWDIAFAAGQANPTAATPLQDRDKLASLIERLERKCPATNGSDADVDDFEQAVRVYLLGALEKAGVSEDAYPAIISFAAPLIAQEAAQRTNPAHPREEIGEEAIGLFERVAYQREEAAHNDEARWRTCSGCHETVDGQETGGYPYSEAFGCILGSGCSDCGGIGALWDTTDYAEYANFALASPSSPPEDANALFDQVYDVLDRNIRLQELPERDDGWQIVGLDQAAREIASSLNRVSIADETRLREVLAPFAREADEYEQPNLSDDAMADGWEDDDNLADVPIHIKVGDLRRASKLLAALSSTPTPIDADYDGEKLKEISHATVDGDVARMREAWDTPTPIDGEDGR